MDVFFKTDKFLAFCSDKTKLTRRYGPVNADRIHQRLAELLAFDTLADLRKLPGPRCHELLGPRKGQLAVDINGELRLIFEPANDPIPRKPDGGLDWTRVTQVRILEISRHYKP
jgi:plasmid maintenance system killer protein